MHFKLSLEAVPFVRQSAICFFDEVSFTLVISHISSICRNAQMSINKCLSSVTDMLCIASANDLLSDIHTRGISNEVISLIKAFSNMQYSAPSKKSNSFGSHCTFHNSL